MIGGYRSSDEDELAELANVGRMIKNDHIKEGEGYSGSNSSDESETGGSGGISIPGARLRRYEDGGFRSYRKTLRLSSEQIVSVFFYVAFNCWLQYYIVGRILIIKICVIKASKCCVHVFINYLRKSRITIE